MPQIPSLPKEYCETRERALAAMNAGEAMEAFQIFRGVVSYPAALVSAEHWHDAFTVFAKIAGTIGGTELGAKIASASDPTDSIALYSLAYDLYEQNLHAVAATVLVRAIEGEPNQSRLVTELVSNLEVMMHFEDACTRLRAFPGLADNVLCQYLLAFNTLMSGDLDDARGLLDNLPTGDEQVDPMLEMLSKIIARAEKIRAISSLDKMDLAGWHLALNGTVLLHRSPHGFDDGMRGRYAFVVDAPNLCRHGIERIRLCAEAAQIDLQRVIALPDRGSMILARATAEVLGLPLETWSAESKDRAGLIVAYDLDSVGDGEILSALNRYRPGQLLWSHASCWTDAFPFSSDFCTFLYQHCRAIYESDEGDTGPSDDDLVSSIVSAVADESYFNDAPALQELVRKAASLTGDARAGFALSDGPRILQRQGSPVRSSQFI